MKFTIKAFAANSHVPETIIRAVVRQMGGLDVFKDRANDVANHGASGGYSGFIYYSDTVAFTKRNKKAIIAFAKEQAEELDAGGIASFIAGFRCVNLSVDEVAEALYHHQSENLDEVANALAWYVLEETARSYADYTYDK
jgi:hypothetical protein